MLSPERARRLSDVALRHSGAEATEVAVTAVEEELNRFTQDHPVQNVLRSAARVSVRVHEGGRQGKASTGTLTDEAVKRTVERARAAARLSPAPPDELLPMPGPQEFRLRGEGPLGHDPDATARAVRTIVDACRERECQVAGIHDTTSTLRLIRNSNGLDVWDVDNTAELSVSAFQGDGAGWSGQIAGAPAGLDTRAAAERAAGKALASRDPQPIGPGHYTVVLEPAAVSSLLLFAAYTGFGAQQVQDGTSFLSGKLGEPVVGENVTITDDAYHPLTVGPVFDGEGLPRQPVTLIEQGVAKGIV
ncbi:MAG: TldD/PmbA family protein, partial [Planctomycetota bacterium]